MIKRNTQSNKVNQKKVCVSFFLLFFLCVGFFYLPTNRVFANLEVEYPTISDQTITAETKLPDYMLYLFNAGMSLGYFAVLISLVIAGVMYFLSPISSKFLSSAKDRVSGAISGLLILTLTYLIITTINPQLSIFHFNELPPTPPPPAEKRAPGVYFYKSSCSEDGLQPYVSSIPDLGDSLRNQVNWAGIVKDTNNKTSYISILYSNPNFWGKCLYLNPNKACQPAVDPNTGSPFASSASIYKYDFDPNGDGVYFYRKACFNKSFEDVGSNYFSTVNDLVAYCNSQSNGYYKVPNSQIKGIYVKKLEELSFTGVPENEQDCVKYNNNGVCIGRTPPSLGGENISSVIINGDYLVMFVYFNPKTDTGTSWASCQEFPTSNDVNRLGPQQMKWQNIRNSSGGDSNGVKISGIIPNYVIIFPIKN